MIACEGVIEEREAPGVSHTRFKANQALLMLCEITFGNEQVQFLVAIQQR